MTNALPAARETTILQAPLDIELIKRMYAKDCTMDEFKVFLALANRYGLDPSLHQIWAIKYPGGGPATIIVSRDGLLEVAHRDGNFDGMESGSRGSVETRDLIGVCKVHRKDMTHPFTVEVHYDEYVQKRRDGSITKFWKEKPRTMIQKVAEAHALRRAFRIQGIYCEDEMPPTPREIPDTSVTRGPIPHEDFIEVKAVEAVKEIPPNPADLPPARSMSSTGIYCEECGRDADPAKQKEILKHCKKHLCDDCFNQWKCDRCGEFE
jgi:phage recombination protein Bet